MDVADACRKAGRYMSADLRLTIELRESFCSNGGHELFSDLRAVMKIRHLSADEGGEMLLPLAAGVIALLLCIDPILACSSLRACLDFGEQKPLGQERRRPLSKCCPKQVGGLATWQRSKSVTIPVKEKWVRA
jgi:hypothetical protein